MTNLTRILVISLLLLPACGGENKNPSPSPAPTGSSPGGDGGGSSSSEGTKTTSQGASVGDGGTKPDSGYFPGGSRLPQ